MIYFLRDEAYNAVKIGYSSNYETFKKRLRSLNCGRPVDLSILLIQEGGNLHSEKQLHEVFRPLLIQREWFKYQGKLKEFIERELKNEAYGSGNSQR